MLNVRLLVLLEADGPHGSLGVPKVRQEGVLPLSSRLNQ